MAGSHDCGGLFGCGDEKGTGILREDIKDGVFDARAADRLLHIDQLDQERFDGFLTARGRARRQLLRASSFMTALAAVGPWFDKLARAGAAVPAFATLPTSAAATPEAPKRPTADRLEIVPGIVRGLPLRQALCVC